MESKIFPPLKPKKETDALKKIPEKHSPNLQDFLAALQRHYRTDFSPAELDDWVAALQRYTNRELDAALRRLIFNPPNDFSGCPNLPTFLRTVYKMREEVSEKMAVSGAFRNHASPGCTTCKGTSWILTKDYSGNDAVYRCECWKANVAAEKAIS